MLALRQSRCVARSYSTVAGMTAAELFYDFKPVRVHFPHKEEKDLVLRHIKEYKRTNYKKSLGYQYRRAEIPFQFAKRFRHGTEIRSTRFVGHQYIPIVPEESQQFILPDQPPIPTLAHHLDHVVKTGGLHPLYDTNLHRFNFDPQLLYIPQPNEINQDIIAPFIPSSQDPILHQLALEQNCKYKGSTSSLSPIVQALYLIISNGKPTLANFLPSFPDRAAHVTRMASSTIAFVIRPSAKDDMYSIDSYKASYVEPSNQILIDLGKILERFLVNSPTEFKRKYMNLSNVKRKVKELDTYRFLKLGNIMMRSQLDAYHTSVDGKEEIFDIKTRANSSIRHSISKWKDYAGKAVTNLTGKSFSYETEFYDMVRSAFIKYSVQARIGGMSGMFMAYHNINNLLGFEFIKLSEIDTYAFGSPYMAETFFSVCLTLLQKVLDKFTSDTPGVPLHIVLSMTDRDGFDFYVNPIVGDKGWREGKSTLPIEYQSKSHEYEGLKLETARCYRIGTQVKINGVDVGNDYPNFTEQDKVEVDYTLWERKCSPSTYLDMLRQASTKS